MISEGYKDILWGIRDKENPGDAKRWGDSGWRMFGADLLHYLEEHPRIASVLDFGAGQGTLGKYVVEHLDRKIEWTNYDPGIKGIDVPPDGKFDLITSSDVLEHIEPEEIDNVIKWMADHAIDHQYHHIACFPSVKKSLPDGRPYHMIVEDVEWWIEAFAKTPQWRPQMYCQVMKCKRGGWARTCQIWLARI